VGHAVGTGATEVVVGLGGSGTNDGGAGLLGALGASSDRPLDQGAAGLDGVTSVDLAPIRDRLAGVSLVCASDSDAPLTGLFGTTRTSGVPKGIAEERLPAVDGVLEQLAAATDRRTALLKGAGAGGGLGFALMLLGARCRPGFDVVAEAVDLAERARAADLVLTGEGAFDFSSGSGTVPYGVASMAAEALRPCVALAGQVLVGSREMRTLGFESAHSVVDLVGEERALDDPGASLAELAARVARGWSR
ncbi:MAG: glycerate kinase, partial [Nocardioides sp.]